VANLLVAVAQVVEDAVAQNVEPELSAGSSAIAALVSVRHQPGLSIDGLRRIVGLTHSGTVRLVDRLEADALITRRKDGGRSVRLSLTASGRRAVRKIEAARLAAVEALLEPLSEDALPGLDARLSLILAAQTENDDDLHRICRVCSFEACQAERQCPVDLAASGQSF